MAAGAAGEADRELEVKFYLSDPEGFEKRVVASGARCVQERIHEHNLRFDTPGGELSRARRVLRLRQDTQARLTYKGRSQTRAGVHSRQEIEFTVGDYPAARALFEALGYQVILVYEKFRTIYRLDTVDITLDEMPYGFFAEIEGPQVTAIRTAARRLDLDWDARILISYTVLFDQLRAALAFTFRDLTFENFQGMDISAAALEVRPADRR